MGSIIQICCCFVFLLEKHELLQKLVKSKALQNLKDVMEDMFWDLAETLLQVLFEVFWWRKLNYILQLLSTAVRGLFLRREGLCS